MQCKRVINICCFQPETGRFLSSVFNCNIIYPDWFRHFFINMVLKIVTCLFLDISKEMSQVREYPSQYLSVLRQSLKQVQAGPIHARYRFSARLHTRCISPPRKQQDDSLDPTGDGQKQSASLPMPMNSKVFFFFFLISNLYLT